MIAVVTSALGDPLEVVLFPTMDGEVPADEKLIREMWRVFLRQCDSETGSPRFAEFCLRHFKVTAIEVHHVHLTHEM